MPITMMMNQIICKNDFIVMQEERNPQSYQIDFFPHSHVRPLLYSISKANILPGATITNQYRSLLFKATTVISLDQLLKKKNYSLSYETALQMLFHLSNQLTQLIKSTHHAFIGYHPENVLVIDENKFLYLSTEHLLKIDSTDETLQITYPFSQDDFYLSPELKKITEIPSHVHYKTSYYSLACVIIDGFKQNELKDKNESITEILQNTPIQYTKLYWVLERCLVVDPKKRSILFI